MWSQGGVRQPRDARDDATAAVRTLTNLRVVGSSTHIHQLSVYTIGETPGSSVRQPSTAPSWRRRRTDGRLIDHLEVVDWSINWRCRVDNDLVTRTAG